MRFLTKSIAVLIISILVIACSTEKKQKKGKRTFKPAKEIVVTKKVEKKVEKVKVIDTELLASKGMGPIDSYKLPELIDQSMVAKGKEMFKSKCAACHKEKRKFIGPGMMGLLERRSPEWALNMMLNTAEMLAKDPIAKGLLKEFNGVPMNDQGLDEQQAKELLEYIRNIK